MDGLSYVEEEEFVEEDQQENTSHVTASSSSQKRIFIDNLSNHIKIGIIGTVNVGKSTLFNCLTQSSKFQSLVDNALFTTIDPYTATFTPFDARMNYLVEQNPEVSKLTPSKLTIIDTAGIIKGSFREVCLEFSPLFFLFYDLFLLFSYSYVLEKRGWNNFP